MRFEIDINRGEAIIGSVKVEVCAVGSKGNIRIGGKDGPVLRQITFGERTLAYRNSCQAEKYADFLSAVITNTATVSPGAGDQNILEIIALHLAGAGNDAPLFTETANMVSKSTGWSAEIIDSHPAVYIDALCLQISGESKPWRTILFAPSKEESILSFKHYLAKSIFKRGSGSSGFSIRDNEYAGNETRETGLELEQPEYSLVKENHAVNRQKILSLSPDYKTKSNALKDLPEDKTLKQESKRLGSNLPKIEQNKKSSVFLKSGDDKKDIEQFPKDLPDNCSEPVQIKKISSSPKAVFSAQIAPSFKASEYADEDTVDGKRFLKGMEKKETDNYFYFRAKAIKKPAKEAKTQKDAVLSDKTVNNAAGSSGSAAGFKQTGILPDKQNKSITIKKYMKDKNKTFIKPDSKITSLESGLESGSLFPSILISLEKDKAPLISSAKKNLNAHNLVQSRADRNKPDIITPAYVYPEAKYDQEHDVKIPEGLGRRQSGFVADKTGIFYNEYTSSVDLANRGENQNIIQAYNLPDIRANKSFMPKDMHFAGNRSDALKQSHSTPKTATSVSGTKSFCNTADEIAMLLHHEADLRGIER